MTLFHWTTDCFRPSCNLVAMAENLEEARRLIREELERKLRTDFYFNVDLDRCLKALNRPPNEVCMVADALIVVPLERVSPV